MKRTTWKARPSLSRTEAKKARIRSESQKRSRRRRSRMETLESRHLLAAISGEVFLDLNQDSMQQATEDGAADVRVYLDENVNGLMDEGEESVLTDSAGIFSFSQLPAGEYHVRVLPGQGLVQTAPQASFGLLETVTDESGVNVRASQAFQFGTNEVDNKRVVELLGQPIVSRLDGITRINDGDLLAVDTRANEVFRINPSNGEITRLGTTNVDIVGGVAYDAVTDSVYTLVRGGGDNSLRRLARLDVNTAKATLIGGGRSGLASVADITFDPVNRRLIGFDDTDNEFFAFDLFGNGQTLSYSSRSVDTFTMSLAGSDLTAGLPAGSTYVTMFDADDTNLVSTILVDVDTGEVTDSFFVSQPIKPVALTRPTTGNNSQYVEVTEFQTVAGLEFGITQDVIGFRVRPSNPESGVGALGQEGLTVVGGAIGPDVVEVTLNRRPEADVVFNLAVSAPGGSNPGVTLETNQLVFTPDDWDQVRRVLVSPDSDNSVNVITNIDLEISVDRDVSDPAWGDLPLKSVGVRVLPPVLSVDLNQPVINELMIDAGFTADFSNLNDQYIELRGTPNERLANGTYFIAISEDNSNEGSVETIIDLSGQTFGANGFLVLLQEGNTYEAAFGSRVLESDQSGFLGLPDGIYSDESNNGSLFRTFDNRGYFLIQTDVPPALGDDIDTDDDQRADEGGLLSTWHVLDAVSIQDYVFGDNFAYAPILFAENISSTSRSYVLPPGGTVVEADGYGYVGRLGDSIGSSAEDWVFGTPVDAADGSAIDFETGGKHELLASSVSQPALADRLLNHIGESNFVGGVRGQILLAPSAGAIANGAPADLRLPGQGITVFADTNGNDRLDDLTFVVEPDDVVPPFDPLDPTVQDLTYVLTNEYPGVTITSTSGSFFSNTPVLAERQYLSGRISGNRVFSDGGFQQFSTFNRLRFDFYRPVKSVSIDALGSAFTSLVSYGRLDAYNADGELIATAVSGVLVNGRRETVSLSVPSDEIVRVEAYSDTTITGGTTFGAFDRLTYVQSEASTETDQDGIYELRSLFEGNYDLQVQTGSGATALLGTAEHPFTVSRFENHVFEDVFRVNTLPRTSDQVILVDENLPVGTEIMVQQADDADQPVDGGVPLLYEIIGGNSAGLVVDSGTGNLTVTGEADLDFETDPNRIITMRITDAAGAKTTNRITISLRDINEAPVVQDTPLVVTEDVPAGSAIGRIQAFDPDIAYNQQLSFELVGGEAQNDFSVDPVTGVVTLLNAGSLDFENNTQRRLLVRVSDDAAIPAENIVEQLILVLNENDRPTISQTQFALPEAATGELFRLEVNDPDEGQTHHFDVVGGSAANFLRVTQEGAVRLLPGAELDFESFPNMTLRLRVSDNGSPPLAETVNIQISLLDVNESPKLQPTVVQFNEGSVPSADQILTLVDPEQRPQDHSIEWLDGPSNSLFEFVAGTGAEAGTGTLRIASGVELDYEDQAVHQLTFRITDTVDNSVLPVTASLLVEVLNRNESPSITTERVVVSEVPYPNGAPSSSDGWVIVGRIGVTDPDGDVVTTQLVGGTGFGNFDLDPNSRLLRVRPNAVFDADVPGAPPLTLVVRADDGTASTDRTLTVQVNNVNEPPVFDMPLANATFQDRALVSGQYLEIQLPDNMVSDPEGGNFSIRIFGESGTLPSWMKYDIETQTLTGTPRPLDTGVYHLTARALEFGPRPLATDVQFTLTVAMGTTPFQNGRNRYDVDSNQSVAPLDALRIINYLQTNGPGALDPGSMGSFPGFLDVSGNGEVTSLDALLVINEINRMANEAAQAVAGAEPIAVETSVDDFLRREDAVDEVLAAELNTPTLF
ncbi:cadherin domain-containing protein [Rhodopirellula sp. P2]|uniref:cadherin domain-containing protein n=1 Tax=Rhodopirellula sp. P2 TaxID=2127060 RepID=UPI00236899BA|nr:cadherin domain-containing protein [Rhodopirellula sp. P2]WDQ17898.1 cadherin domain-containing protein [Rhodopirellula sp. P2]